VNSRQINFIAVAFTHNKKKQKIHVLGKNRMTVPWSSYFGEG